jgi:hypothetical protein
MAKPECVKMILDYCPLCGKHLPDYDRTTRWIHDIMNHRGYFEAQCEDTPAESIREMLYEIIEKYHKSDDNLV